MNATVKIVKKTYDGEVATNPTIDWKNPTFKLGVAIGKLMASDNVCDMDRDDFCYNINEFVVDEADVPLSLELLEKLWGFYTSDGAKIVDDKYVLVGGGNFGAWYINDKGRCAEYEDWSDEWCETDDDDDEEKFVCADCSATFKGEGQVYCCGCMSVEVCEDCYAKAKLNNWYEENDDKEEDEEYPVDMTDDDKHIVSISAEEQEENDKTANKYDEEDDEEDDENEIYTKKYLKTLKNPMRKNEFLAQVKDCDNETKTKVGYEFIKTMIDAMKKDGLTNYGWEIVERISGYNKKKALMLAEPDDDETFRSLCMDTNEINGYGRIC